MLGFITHNAALGIGPERDHDDFVLVAGTGSALAPLMQQAGHHVLAVDQLTPELAADERLSAATVLAVPAVEQQLKQLGVRALVPFKPSERLLRIAKHQGIEILSAAPRLVRQLENKLSLPEIAAAAGVRAPQTTQVMLDEDFSLHTGWPLVFQPAVDFAGSGTRLLQGPADAAGLAAENRRAVGKLTELIEGEPLTLNGVVLGPGDVLVGGVTRQLTGVPECSERPFGSCGNDWCLPIAEGVIAAARAMAASVGAVLAERGFRGGFGIDVVAPQQGDAVLIEVNPRCTASLSLTVQLQQASRQPTLFDLHLAAFGQREVDPRARELYDPASGSAAQPERGAASLIVFNRDADDGMVPAPLQPGAWALRDSELQLAQPAWRLDQLPDDGHFLVLPQPPTRPLAAGVEIARLIVPHQAVENATARSLVATVAQVVEAVREKVRTTGS